MKKRIKLIAVSMILVMLNGCQRVTINDARDIASLEKGKIIKNVRIYNEQRVEKETTQNVVQDNNNKEPFSLDTDVKDKEKIIVNEVGSLVELKYMSCQVTDVRLSTNINDLYSFANETSADIIVNDIITDYGSESKISILNNKIYVKENGELNEKFEQIMFIKMKINNGANGFTELCIAPTLYEKNENGTYSYMVGIDEFYTDSVQQTGDDRLFYKFNKGEEKEFVIAIMSREDLSGKDIYMNANFILPFSNGNNMTELLDGTQFIKLSLSE